MKIRIRKDAAEIYKGNNMDWVKTLKSIAGLTLEVETEYLFKDQYNTVPIKGVSETGLRIMANLVEEVIDDIRPTMQRCNWCGKISLRREICPHCQKSEYLERFSDISNAERFILETKEVLK